MATPFDQADKAHISLLDALINADAPGWTDVGSNLGLIFLPSVNFWCPTHPKLTLSVGKEYIFRNRDGKETKFVAAHKTNR